LSLPKLRNFFKKNNIKSPIQDHNGKYLHWLDYFTIQQPAFFSLMQFVPWPSLSSNTSVLSYPTEAQGAP